MGQNTKEYFGIKEPALRNVLSAPFDLRTEDLKTRALRRPLQAP